MKALAGMLLAFTLAAGIGSQADAKECSHKHASKHVAKSSVKHHGSALASHKSKKSHRTMCVCKAGTSKTKHIGSTGMMKSSSFGGYKPKHVNSIMVTPMESTDTMFNGNRSLNNDQNLNNGNRNMNNNNRNFNNGTRGSDSLFNPNGIYDNNNLNNRNVDSMSSGSSGEFMDHGK